MKRGEKGELKMNIPGNDC